jgi:hypothetical protein
MNGVIPVIDGSGAVWKPPEEPPEPGVLVLLGTAGVPAAFTSF